MEFQLEHSVQDGALQLPMQPPDLARLTSAAPGAPGAPGAPVLGRGLSAEKRDAVLVGAWHGKSSRYSMVISKMKSDWVPGYHGIYR